MAESMMTTCGLTVSEIFERAGKIATARFPDGCSDADLLAAIVREVIAVQEIRNGTPPDEFITVPRMEME